MFDTFIWRLFIRIEAKLIKMFMSLLNDIQYLHAFIRFLSQFYYLSRDNTSD